MRDFDEEESPRFSFPTRSGAGAGAGADRSVRPMTSQGGNWDHRDRDREPSTPDPMLSSLSRPDSRSRAVRSAMLPAVAGGRFPSGSFNAIHGGIHGRSQSGPGPATPSGTGLAHDRNMHNAFEMFNRHFSGSQSGGQGQGQGQTPQSPSTPGSSSGFGAAATPESAEMVARFNEVTDTASRLNAGLRALIQTTLEAQIDAELNDPGRGGVGDGANVAAAMAFREIDRGLNSLLKLSDDQVRNLTEGLIAFTRAERERDRLRKALNMDSGSVGGRPGSRLSSLGAAAGGSASTATSPAEPRRSSRDLISDRRGAGASGTEGLRRAASVRDYPSPTGTVIEHESGGPRSDRSGQSGKAGANERARVSLARPLGGAAGIGGMMSPTLPYSPTPLPGNNRGVGSGGNTLPSRMHASALGSGSLHGRSASELSPSSHSTMGAGAGSGTGRSREKSSANSTSSTIRPPSQLSPRRPKLSFPTTSVSNATASFSASASSVGDDGSAGGSLIAFPSREERREERREARQDARDARDPTGTFSLTRAREFASEPVALNLSSSQSSGTSHATAVAGSNSRGDGAAAETSPSASATSSLVGSAGKGAAPPPRRNTISVGLGVGSDRLRGGNESGRVGTGAGVRAPPPRPPRHDLMQVDVDDEDDAGGHDGVADSSISNKSRRSRAFPQTPQTASAISRFGALGLGNMVSRSLGRGAGRRISAAFEPGQVQVQGGSGSAQADAELETEGGGPGETEMSADEEFGRLKRRASRSASRNALRDNDRTVGARGSASGSGTVRRSGAVPGA